ncbi:MAG: PorT family protein [Bacteroidales bacterium]|nr:PorT family protein [Bacteroidales bacterium]
MKKLFITIAFVAATMFASAQLYVGGNIGMNTQSAKVTTESNGVSVTADGPKWFGFEFNPSAGFMFNEKMGVGLDLTFGFNKRTTKGVDEDGDKYTRTVKTTTIGFAPYFRYIFAEIDNFKFYADGKIDYRISTPKTTIDYDEMSLSVDGDKTNRLFIGVVPGMAYQLTDNFSLNCKLNILSLGYTSIKEVEKDGGTTTTTKYSEFDLGINDPTPITIGVFYTF